MTGSIDATTYTINNLRFESEEGGYVTIWFDLGGPDFSEPEAMANMFIEFDDLLQYLEQEQPALYETLAGGQSGQEAWQERLEEADFDWEGHLRVYIDRNIDLQAVEQERIGWLQARRARAAAQSVQPQLESDWDKLSAQAEPSALPTWDDVAHALIDSLNATAVELYPELLEYDADGNSRLRDMIESHGERLANQLYALTKSVREEQDK